MFTFQNAQGESDQKNVKETTHLHTHINTRTNTKHTRINEDEKNNR